MKDKNKKSEPWIKLRHKIVQRTLAPLFAPFCRWKYGVDIKDFRKEQRDRPFLILMNHQTVFDQFFVAIAFQRPVYFIATEDIFSNGWVSSLIRWLVAPIPIKKQTSDLRAVRTCLKVAKEGGTIALAPEGNRTYDGKTVYINPAIAALARKLRMPIAFFRIEGGYGVDPRWGGKVRKGKMKAYVSRVIEPEELAGYSSEELYDIICKELYVNEAVVDGEFHHKQLAEYLERVFYVCPHCGLSVFESHNDIVECKTCGRQIRYLPTREFQGVGFEFPHRFVTDWYEAQNDYVNQLDLSAYTDFPMYTDRADFSEVIVYKKKVLLKQNAEIKLYGNRICIAEGQECEHSLMFDTLSVVTVLGRNKLNIYCGDKIYQLKGNKRFNALKYMNIFYRYQNGKQLTGGENGKFLGL